jgi:hypothetical protein
VYNASVYLQDQTPEPLLPTPIPSSSLVEEVPAALAFSSDGYLLVAWVLGVALILLTAIIMVRSILAAATRPPPSMLIVALSLLTLLAVAGGVVTNNDEAWTIAAAGVGALAGSVTSLFERYNGKEGESNDNNL